MNMVKAIFIKQTVAQIKMPIMIIQAIFYLVIGVLAFLLVSDDDPYACGRCIPAYISAECAAEAAEGFQLPDISMTGLLMALLMGLALVGGAAQLGTEDRATTNLKFMHMAGVRPWHYLAGTFPSVIMLAAILLIPFAILSTLEGTNFVAVVFVGLVAAVVSTILGITIGLSRAPYLAMPLGLFLGMGPQFAAANETVARIFHFTYIHQLQSAISDTGADLTSNLLIIVANGAAAMALFIWAHRKGKLNVDVIEAAKDTNEIMTKV